MDRRTFVKRVSLAAVGAAAVSALAAPAIDRQHRPSAVDQIAPIGRFRPAWKFDLNRPSGSIRP
jgi:hypothetical protein